MSDQLQTSSFKTFAYFSQKRQCPSVRTNSSGHASHSESQFRRDVCFCLGTGKGKVKEIPKGDVNQNTSTEVRETTITLSRRLLLVTPKREGPGDRGDWTQ